MSDADEARAELLAFAERLHRARGLSRLDGTPSVGLSHDGGMWRATTHLLGRRVAGDVGTAGVGDGAAGVACAPEEGMQVTGEPEPGQAHRGAQANRVIESLEAFDPAEWGLPPLTR